MDSELWKFLAGSGINHSGSTTLNDRFTYFQLDSPQPKQFNPKSAAVTFVHVYSSWLEIYLRVWPEQLAHDALLRWLSVSVRKKHKHLCRIILIYNGTTSSICNGSYRIRVIFCLRIINLNPVGICTENCLQKVLEFKKIYYRRLILEKSFKNVFPFLKFLGKVNLLFVWIFFWHQLYTGIGSCRIHWRSISGFGP